MKILKRVFMILLVLILVFDAAFLLYTSMYYHADETAEEAEQKSEKDGDYLVFEPSEDTGTALIFYPGGKVEYDSYAPLMEACAEKGILCILLKVPHNLAILDVHSADEVDEKFAQIRHWYLGGHSLGGVTAAMDAGSHPGEYEGLVLLGAYSGTDLSQSGMKVLQMYGSEDGVLNRKKLEENAGNLPSDTVIKVIEGGNHAQFGSYGEQKGDGTAEITPEEQWEQTAEAIAELTGVQEQ